MAYHKGGRRSCLKSKKVIRCHCDLQYYYGNDFPEKLINCACFTFGLLMEESDTLIMPNCTHYDYVYYMHMI